MRFHILGLAHTISTPEYTSCAFTQKVVKLCDMLSREGHEVIHYGHEKSVVNATQHVTVVRQRDQDLTYGTDWDWRARGFPAFDGFNDHAFKVFNSNAIAEIKAHAQPNDFLLCPFGTGHQAIARHFPDMIVVESGIGYPTGTFAPYRIFESYAIMHAYQGVEAAKNASNDFWYDAVIPNSFEPDEFDFNDGARGKDFFLFLGRVNEGKGIHIATQIAEATKTRLVVAGQGVILPTSDLIKPVGVIGQGMRRSLLSEAKAVICASTFLEPFCGVQIEAMLSGAPVISTDRGAFAEYNLHGRTGYRCRTFEQFQWAAENIGAILPQDCRDHGLRFSNAAIAPRYTEYFRSLLDIRTGKGWYEPAERSSLDLTAWGPN